MNIATDNGIRSDGLLEKDCQCRASGPFLGIVNQVRLTDSMPGLTSATPGVAGSASNTSDSSIVMSCDVRITCGRWVLEVAEGGDQNWEKT